MTISKCKLRVITKVNIEKGRVKCKFAVRQSAFEIEGGVEQCLAYYLVPPRIVCLSPPSSLPPSLPDILQRPLRHQRRVDGLARLGGGGGGGVVSQSVQCGMRGREGGDEEVTGCHGTIVNDLTFLVGLRIMLQQSGYGAIIYDVQTCIQ